MENFLRRCGPGRLFKISITGNVCVLSFPQPFQCYFISLLCRCVVLGLFSNLFSQPEWCDVWTPSWWQRDSLKSYELLVSRISFIILTSCLAILSFKVREVDLQGKKLAKRRSTRYGNYFFFSQCVSSTSGNLRRDINRKHFLKVNIAIFFYK